MLHKAWSFDSAKMIHQNAVLSLTRRCSVRVHVAVLCLPGPHRRYIGKKGRGTCQWLFPQCPKSLVIRNYANHGKVARDGLRSKIFRGRYFADYIALRVQVPNKYILTQNLYYNCYYPNPKYLIIGYMDPLGRGVSSGFRGES